MDEWCAWRRILQNFERDEIELLASSLHASSIDENIDGYADNSEGDEEPPNQAAAEEVVPRHRRYIRDLDDAGSIRGWLRLRNGFAGPSPAPILARQPHERRQSRPNMKAMSEASGEEAADPGTPS
ncbi:GH23536 [Drosophila grimshawi]|uniref:GH23536 n=1 Tax=Drosophila grimshawi TaxID=7222 RepID=B4K0Q8_DROGR|nr:GH23536 [Drosophila grimshawi]